jgi:hypothetical protein
MQPTTGPAGPQWYRSILHPHRSSVALRLRGGASDFISRPREREGDFISPLRERERESDSIFLGEGVKEKVEDRPPRMPTSSLWRRNEIQA